MLISFGTCHYYNKIAKQWINCFLATWRKEYIKGVEAEQRPESYRTMENEDNNLNTAPTEATLINIFCEITSFSKFEALFFLESHNFNLDSTISTFLENNTSLLYFSTGPNPSAATKNTSLCPESSLEDSQSYSPSHSEKSSSSSSCFGFPFPPSSKRQRKPFNTYNFRSLINMNFNHLLLSCWYSFLSESIDFCLLI